MGQRGRRTTHERAGVGPPDDEGDVEIVLTADGDHTVVNLIHSDLPSDRRPDHLAGWTTMLDNLRVTASSIPRAEQ
jgi:hypothetical protein